MRLELCKSDMFLELDPMAAGAVSRFRHGDLDVLRPAPSRIGPAFDPLAYAAFTMVPFVGRIHLGRFETDGESHQLPANFPPEPHALHGHGWQSAWRVESEASDTATLIYHHRADSWRWDYTARQTFQLIDKGLLVRLSVTNDAETRMPAGLGWHPYFMRENAILTLTTSHIWQPDLETGDNLPRPISPDSDLSHGRRVPDLTLDTTYSVQADTVEITWPTHTVRMTSDPVFSHATVYVPPGQDYFCVEPVTHAPNAVNSRLPTSQSGFQFLEPGETLSGSVRLMVEH